MKKNSEKLSEIQSELIRIVYLSTPLSLIAVLVNSTILSAVQWTVISHTTILAWFGITNGLSLIRLGVYIKFRSLGTEQAVPVLWGRLVLVISVASGATWGAVAIWLFPEDNVAHQVFAAFVLAGMCAGGVTTLSPILSSIYAYLLLIMSPLIIRFFIVDTSINYAMATMSILFTVMLLGTSKRFNQTIRESLLKGYERNMMEERFRVGIEASPAAMIMVEKNGDIVYANHQTESLFEYSPGELIGKSIDILVPDSQRIDHPSHREMFVQNPSARKMGGRDLSARKKHGETFPVEVGLNPIDTTEGMVVLCSVVDLTDRKKYEEEILLQSKLLEMVNKRLYEEATIDSLTNIANRRSLFSHLETYLQLARRNGRPVSFLLADVDYFKNYNDEFGHPAGDEALKAVAKTLQEQTRDSDIVARYGGEEFAILLAEIDQNGAINTAEKIRQRIEVLTGLNSKITVSIGVATLSIVQNEPFDLKGIINTMIKNADEALYYSKGNGRNMVTHFDNINLKT